MARYADPRRSMLACLSLLSSILLADARADAATISLILDKASYEPGDTVTLRLVGDSQGALDRTLWATVKIDLAALLNRQAQLFQPPTTDATPWTQGFIQGCSHPGYSATYPDECVLMSMVSPVAGLYLALDPASEPFTYAVVTGIAGAPGTYPIAFATAPISHRLDFFGLTSAPGTTLLIHNPEPATATLLALGLGGMALAQRRRVRH